MDENGRSKRKYIPYLLMNALPQALYNGKINEKWELIAFLDDIFFKKVNRKMNALVRSLEQVRL
jgi:hypothetical protein